MALHDPITTDEKRGAKLTELTREAAAGINDALAAGLPNMTQLIDEALGDYLQDDQARAELLRKTAAGGNPFTKVLADLVWTEAGVRAEQELARLEKEGADDADEARIDAATWDRENA